MKVALARAAIVAAFLLLAMSVAAQAQQAGRVHRVGLVSPVSPSAQHQAFRERLRELGYIEGQNLIVEARFAEGQPDRIPGLVAEVIRLKVDVLVVGADPVALAAKNATTTGMSAAKAAVLILSLLAVPFAGPDRHGGCPDLDLLQPGEIR